MPARAGHDVVNAIARSHIHVHMGFARQFPILCFGVQNVLGQRAGRATGQPAGGANEAIGADHDLSGAQEAPLFIDGYRAPMLAGTARIRHIAKPVNDQRELTFEHLRRNRSVGPESHGGYAINTVLARPSAPTPKENIHHRKRCPVFFLTGKVQDIPTLSGNGHPVG